MDILTFACLAILVFIALIKYSEHTAQQALEKRWEMIEYYNREIANASELSTNMKSLCVTVINDSLDRFLLPRLLFYAVLDAFRTPHQKNEINQYLYGSATPSQEAQIKYETFIRSMIKVNAYNAPHWYFLFVIVLFSVAMVYFVFRKTNKSIESFMHQIVQVAIKQKSHLVA